ncbi:MAG TPA: NHLP bacteriocin export ABC transporter permease/ATPase subunit [Herpetosiphonaceae bacterium]
MDPGAPDELFAACQRVGAALGLELRRPPPGGDGDPLQAIARASGTRTRLVALKDDWWRRDQGPLLGFVEDSRAPVALLPDGPGRYKLYDPRRDRCEPLTAALAWTLAPFGHVFVRPLPDGPLDASGLVRFGLRGARADLLTLLSAGLAGGLIGLLPPLATRWVVDDLIPAGDRGQIAGLLWALAAVALAGALLQLARTVASLRIETRLGAAVQEALWDRLLGLPAAFFRRYEAGDLAFRALSVDRMRAALSGTTASALIGALFALVNLAVLWALDAGMAAVACGLIGLAAAAMLLAGRASLRIERAILAGQGALAGLALQLISGAARLRLAGAERRAFERWAAAYGEQRERIAATRRIGALLAMFNAVFPLLSLLLFFVLADRSALGSPGRFLAFAAAFANLAGAALLLSGGLLTLLRIVPVFEQLRPLLEAAPERQPGRRVPARLAGAVELRNVSFRYGQDSPPALDDVSLRVEPGSFVALVGPSGSGKSSLLRLLLGFEQAQAGGVAFDGVSLDELDVPELRRQIGAVLQHSRPLPGDIAANILGAAGGSIEQVWEAARLVGLDEEIRRLPMGMYTLIGEAGSTLSSGQSQRLLLARALAGRPALLLLDEATSALDNRAQAAVAASLDQLKLTRIVVAHRLSTVRNADRIYVLDQGKIVQEGSFEELSGSEGLFRDLMRGQLPAE